MYVVVAVVCCYAYYYNNDCSDHHQAVFVLQLLHPCYSNFSVLTISIMQFYNEGFIYNRSKFNSHYHDDDLINAQ